MNTQTIKNQLISKTGLLLAGLITLTTTPAFAGDSYQEKLLLEPSESMLRAEARGHIMIYDGLEVAVIDKAMDEQFDRIDNMMFTRTRHPVADSENEYVVDDDGCDY